MRCVDASVDTQLNLILFDAGEVVFMWVVYFLQEDNLEVYGRTHMIDCPLGVPGLSIPIGLAANEMPIGIMLYGRPGVAQALSCAHIY